MDKIRQKLDKNTTDTKKEEPIKKEYDPLPIEK